MAEQTKKHHYVLAAVLAIVLAGIGLTMFPRDTAKQPTEVVSIAPQEAQIETTAGEEKQPEATTDQTAEAKAPEPSQEQATSPRVDTAQEDEALKAELAKADPKWAEPRGNKVGNPNAPVKIKEFASLSCAHCAHFHNTLFPEIKKKYVDTGKVEFEFIGFPLNAPALDGLLVLNCLPKDSYYSFMTLLFETQEHWAFAQDHLTPLRQNAKLAGLSDAKFDSCIKDEGKRRAMAEAALNNSKKYKIQSTPTFIINDGADMILGARPIEGFAEKIDPLLAQKK